ncbi:hypothetical protein BST81_16305 [Leptolyngbya sp. 'hensonii']|uniref:iron uptake porin n=1 Tax=Leptolyngbya sp. 'hensonii' TaxID=1922337 RepID=UPI0009502F4D|nr:iron uptake porin [Leptolyngbya sp. 'hensonii']OLP17361.1 hypothetical protein BST81_16305 [Leptolyngbya sp. 'hensonii']
MQGLSGQLRLTGFLLLGAIPISCGPAWADEASTNPGRSVLSPLNQIEVYRNGYHSGMPVIVVNTSNQVTSVSQLSDVQPTDWAFQALQSLVERYGCVVGYPDGTYRGNRPLTRYEFAAGLNACMDRINELIAAATTNLVTKEDLEIVKRLQEEFAAELATLRGRVDALEARTARLEAQQFSTTTKLSGEVILAITDAFGGSGVTDFAGNPNAPVNAEGNTVFQERVRLNFVTSFSGKDRLQTRLQVGNTIPVLTTTTPAGLAAVNLFANEGRLAQDNTTIALTNNSVYLDLLSYQVPIGSQAQLSIFANAGFHYHYADTLSPYLDSEDGGSGAISRFGERNPIYNINGNNGAVVPGGAGVGFTFRPTDAIRLDVGYLASRASTPTPGSGLFNGNYSALAQVVFQPFRGLKLGFTYVNAYNAAGTFRFGGAGNAVGSFRGNLLFPFAPDPLAPANNSPVASNSYGVEASFQVAPGFVIGGWGGFTAARLITFGDAEIWNYALTLSFPDLGKKGNLAAIIIGAEPTLKGLQSGGQQVALPDRDDSLHIEGFYKYQVNDNISITPGLIWLPAINQRGANSDVFIGTIRTTFSF